MTAAQRTEADVLMLIVIVALLLVSMFLAVAETALTRMNKARANALADEGGAREQALAELVSTPESFLNPILLIVLVCQIVQANLTGIVAGRLFGALGVAVAIFINVVVVFVLAEAAPKTWAVQHGDRAALLAARPVRFLTRLWPLRITSQALIGLTNVILPGKGLKKGPFVSEEELLAVADLAVADQVIEVEERALIESIIEFGDTIVREVMVPRPDMVTVTRDFRVGDVMEVVVLNGYSRLPVCGEGIDDVVGIVYAKDLMRAERDGKEDQPIRDLVRPARFVPETKRVAELLKEMQAEKFHMAIVVDEYGGTAGLVTLEDLIEELVGEIVDEFDVEDPMVEPLPGGDVRVNARMLIDDLNDLLGCHLPEGDWDTVGGLLFSQLGHVPVEGESIDIDGWRLTAQRVQGRRIGRVRMTRLGPARGRAEAG